MKYMHLQKYYKLSDFTLHFGCHDNPLSNCERLNVIPTLIIIVCLYLSNYQYMFLFLSSSPHKKVMSSMKIQKNSKKKKQYNRDYHPALTPQFYCLFFWPQFFDQPFFWTFHFLTNIFFGPTHSWTRNFGPILFWTIYCNTKILWTQHFWNKNDSLPFFIHTFLSRIFAP